MEMDRLIRVEHGIDGSVWVVWIDYDGYLRVSKRED